MPENVAGTQYSILRKSNNQILGVAFGRNEHEAITSYLQIVTPVGVQHSDLFAEDTK